MISFDEQNVAEAARELQAVAQKTHSVDGNFTSKPIQLAQTRKTVHTPPPPAAAPATSPQPVECIMN